MYGPMINICEKLNDTRHFRALQNNLREKKAQWRRNKNSVRFVPLSRTTPIYLEKGNKQYQKQEKKKTE